MNMNQNHRVRNTSQHLNYLSGFRMALTNAEKQNRWRDRKKERNPEQFKQGKRAKTCKIYTYNRIICWQTDSRTSKRQRKVPTKMSKKRRVQIPIGRDRFQPSTSGTSWRQNGSAKLILKFPYPNKFSKKGTGAKKYDSALKRAHREIEKLKEENRKIAKQKIFPQKGFKENIKWEIWKSSILIRTLQHQERQA